MLRFSHCDFLTENGLSSQKSSEAGCAKVITAGDIIGSVYEKRNLKRKDFFHFFRTGHSLPMTPCVLWRTLMLCSTATATRFIVCRTGDSVMSMWAEWGAAVCALAGGRQSPALWLLGQRGAPCGWLLPHYSRAVWKKSWNCPTP